MDVARLSWLMNHRRVSRQRGRHVSTSPFIRAGVANVAETRGLSISRDERRVSRLASHYRDARESGGGGGGGADGTATGIFVVGDGDSDGGGHESRVS